jgi:hypothetical protein
MHLIPKTKAAQDPKQWRPVALTSCIQKLFLGIVIRLVNLSAKPIDSSQCGFQESRQTAEVAEATRIAVRKCYEWGVDIFVLKTDVMRAFDSMQHGFVLEALINDGVLKQLQHSVMQEFRERDVNLSFQGCIWNGIKFIKGGRQGGVETPSLWVRLLNLAVVTARKRWTAEVLGFCFANHDIFSHATTLNDAGPPADFVLDCMI